MDNYSLMHCLVAKRSLISLSMTVSYPLLLQRSQRRICIRGLNISAIYFHIFTYGKSTRRFVEVQTGLSGALTVAEAHSPQVPSRCLTYRIKYVHNQQH